jgi:hypothetical protein
MWTTEADRWLSITFLVVIGLVFLGAGYSIHKTLVSKAMEECVSKGRAVEICEKIYK